jgi:hypothetical protein
MKANKITRKDGSIGIPSYMKKKAGLLKKTPVSLTLNNDGSILIQPMVQNCVFCESQTTKVFKGSPVCKKCAEEMSKLYE